MCRVAERSFGKFKMCANCQWIYYCNSSSQLKEWKQHKTVHDAISQVKLDRKANMCKIGSYNTTLPPSEPD